MPDLFVIVIDCLKQTDIFSMLQTVYTVFDVRIYLKMKIVKMLHSARITR